MSVSYLMDPAEDLGRDPELLPSGWPLKCQKLPEFLTFKYSWDGFGLNHFTLKCSCFPDPLCGAPACMVRPGSKRGSLRPNVSWHNDRQLVALLYLRAGKSTVLLLLYIVSGFHLDDFHLSKWRRLHGLVSASGYIFAAHAHKRNVSTSCRLWDFIYLCTAGRHSGHFLPVITHHTMSFVRGFLVAHTQNWLKRELRTNSPPQTAHRTRTTSMLYVCWTIYTANTAGYHVYQLQRTGVVAFLSTSRARWLVLGEKQAIHQTQLVSLRTTINSVHINYSRLFTVSRSITFYFTIFTKSVNS